MDTRPHITDSRMIEIHTLDVPVCCPISHNPMPGSSVRICYRPLALVLDVIPLPLYLRSYMGGKRGPGGEIEVRDMEAMIQRIADDCCEAVGVPVRVYADLLLRPAQQRMALKARAYPSKLAMPGLL